MFEYLTKVIGWLKTQPISLRLIIITLLAALAAALTFTSCSRSTMRFKGTGDVEYYFKGSNGPTLLDDSNSY